MEAFIKKLEDGVQKEQVFYTDSGKMLFTDFLSNWLEIMKASLEVTTYSS